MSRAGELLGEKITVLGSGVSGLSLARLASRLGADVFLSEAGKISAEAIEILNSLGVAFEMGGHSRRALICDRALISSGFPPAADVVKMLKEHGVPLVGELDFVHPFLRGRIIGVTGSNGKTTTTSLLGHLLKSLGNRAETAGNIGRPIADLACVELDFIVAEFSSFQLYWSGNLSVDIAVVTNIAPDHLDWHGSYQNYVKAKTRLLTSVADGGFSILQKKDMEILGVKKEGAFALTWSEGKRPNSIVLNEGAGCANLLCGEEEVHLFDFSDSRLLGRHNLENTAMAMSALCLLGADTSSARSSLKDYVPAPHRCALVAEIAGVSYVDDSKGTNVAATMTALSSLPRRKIIILGGRGKGEDYGQLEEALRANAKWAILIGEAAPEIESALRKRGYDAFSSASGMEEAVDEAASRAQSGDMVLLSPACTSWDAYANYGERGDHFASLVRRRIEGSSS